MGWYLGIIRRHLNQNINIYIYIYICTEEVQDITPNIFKKSPFNSWFQQLKDKQSTFIINTTHRNVHLLNQVKEGIPRRGRIYPKTLNKDDFCYQGSKNGLD